VPSAWSAPATAATGAGTTACAIGSATATPSTVRRRSTGGSSHKGKLLTPVALAVNTSGSCEALRAVVPTMAGESVAPLAKAGTSYTFTIPRDSPTWMFNTGNLRISIRDATTEQAQIALLVTN
jgi:hypothetical protein